MKKPWGCTEERVDEIWLLQKENAALEIFNYGIWQFEGR
jgi:hypothetical protein